MCIFESSPTPCSTHLLPEWGCKKRFTEKVLRQSELRQTNRARFVDATQHGIWSIV